MSERNPGAWQALHEREAYRIILSSGGAKPTFGYLVRELAKNIGTPTKRGQPSAAAASEVLGRMIAESAIAVDDEGRFYIT